MKKLFIFSLLGFALFTQSCINDNEDPIVIAPTDGAVVDAEVGGAAQPNQVWIDLSSEDKTVNRRTDWDLAFYSGSQFKVAINYSIMMAAGAIPNKTNIDDVKESDVEALKSKVDVGTFDPANEAFIDDPKGLVTTGRTAIAEISAVDSENAIYLVNMGRDIYTGAEVPGTVYTAGAARGWKKVQIVRSNDGYKVKYADLNDTTHKEYIVSKKVGYNYTFFSMKDNKEANVQPEASKWDLGFTVITNVIAGAGSYIYADFVVTNVLGNVGVYQVLVTAPTTGQSAYENFKLENVESSKFVNDNQTIIGANWRNPVGTNGLEVYSDRFYVIRDAEGYFFKLRFTRMTNVNGMRGFPQFEYKPL